MTTEIEISKDYIQNTIENINNSDNSRKYISEKYKEFDEILDNTKNLDEVKEMLSDIHKKYTNCPINFNGEVDYDKLKLQNILFHKIHNKIKFMISNLDVKENYDEEEYQKFCNDKKIIFSKCNSITIILKLYETITNQKRTTIDFDPVDFLSKEECYTDAKIAENFYNMFKEKYLYDCDMDDWYYITYHGIWKNSNNYKKKIDEDFDIFYKYVSNFNEDNIILFNSDDKKKEQEKQEKLKIIKKNLSMLNKKLNSNTEKEKIIRELMKLFGSEKVEFNNLPNLIGFENGVLNVDTFQFGGGNPEDYVSFTTGYDFDIEFMKLVGEEIKEFYQNKFNSNNENNICKVVYDIVGEEVFEYSLYCLSQCMYGKQLNPIFQIWSGNGSNGKSFLGNLLLKAFGNYAITIPSGIILGTSEDQKPNPYLLKLKNKRINYLEEPDMCKKINTSMVKKLVGGTPLKTRALFSNNVVEIKTNFMCIMAVNMCPLLESVDGGIERRIQNIEFKTKFVDEPVKDYEKKKNYEFINDNVINELAKKLFYLLLHFYSRCKVENKGKLPELPKCMSIMNQSFMEDSDKILGLINTYIKKIENPDPSNEKHFLLKKSLKTFFDDTQIKQQYNIKNIGPNVIIKKIEEHFNAKFENEPYVKQNTERPGFKITTALYGYRLIDPNKE